MNIISQAVKWFSLKGAQGVRSCVCYHSAAERAHLFTDATRRPTTRSVSAPTSLQMHPDALPLGY